MKRIYELGCDKFRESCNWDSRSTNGLRIRIPGDRKPKISSSDWYRATSGYYVIFLKMTFNDLSGILVAPWGLVSQMNWVQGVVTVGKISVLLITSFMLQPHAQLQSGFDLHCSEIPTIYWNCILWIPKSCFCNYWWHLTWISEYKFWTRMS